MKARTEKVSEPAPTNKPPLKPPLPPMPTRKRASTVTKTEEPLPPPPKPKIPLTELMKRYTFKKVPRLSNASPINSDLGVVHEIKDDKSVSSKDTSPINQAKTIEIKVDSLPKE